MPYKQQSTLPLQSVELSREQQVQQEDAWLNDVGPAAQEEIGSRTSAKRPVIRPEQTIPLPSPELFPPVPQMEPISDVTIDPDHPLWPTMLQLADQLWRWSRDLPEEIVASELALIEAVRKHALDLIRAEPVASLLIRDIIEAGLLLRCLINEVVGYGPLKPLLLDPSISQVVVISPDRTYVERGGCVEEVSCRFASIQHMRRIIENLLRQAGFPGSARSSLVDTYLPDGSLLTVALPPNTVVSPTITIRKQTCQPLSLSDLVARGTLSQSLADILLTHVQARSNIVICGHLASGKTTLLNALCMDIPSQEHIITVEDIAELHLSQRQKVTLVSCFTGPTSTLQVTMRDLVRHARRLRPDRIIVDECCGDEVTELLQAMYSGFKGVMMTMYAADVQDCLTRLEMLCLASGISMPVEILRAQLARSLDVIVYLSSFEDGAHKIYEAAEILDMMMGTNLAR